MIYYITTKNHVPFLDKDNNLLLFSSEEYAKLFRDLVLLEKDYAIVKKVEPDPSFEDSSISTDYKTVEELIEGY